MAQMYVYSYEQLVAIVNQQNAKIAQQAAVIINLRSERQWLEEDNQTQREGLEKSQKNLKDLETSRKLKESKLRKELQQLKESHGDIKWRHKNAVRELNHEKGKNLKMKAHCTSLLEKLDESNQELRQKQKELDRAKQELDLGYTLGECMYQHLRYYYWGYFELLKYFQWSRPSSGGATITELDSNEITSIEENTVAVLPHSYSLTQEVLVSSKPCSKTVIVPVLDADKIPAPVNMVKETETDSPTTLTAQNVIQSDRSNSICPQTAYIPSNAPSRDLNPIEFLLFNNNTTSWSICQVPGVPQISALHSEVPTRPSNHLQLAISAPECLNTANKLPGAVKGVGPAPRIPKIERLIPTMVTKSEGVNITSGETDTFKSSSKESKEEHEIRSDEPKDGHCHSTTVTSEHWFPLANNGRELVDFDGEKQVSTRKRTGVKKTQSLKERVNRFISWLRHHSCRRPKTED
ncbi:unnamed protein product [Porites evermanni]|uniref:Uncharacterized protein n=1 Tax=Porites evermanni TaxID=104178 RepID=A0ABN8MBM5_9CNID|nr:unnamed protein product [Porites evermanni]